MTSDEIWASLEDEAMKNGFPGIVKRRIYPDSLFDLFMGYDNNEHRRMLLLKVHRSLIHAGGSYPKSRGMEAQIVELPDDDPEHATLELVLISPEFKDIFTCLVEDIADQIKDEKSESSMVNRFVGRLLKWQQFLDKYVSEGLSDEAQRGLYGELWFMRRYLLTSLGTAPGIDAWSGPEGSPQDFRFGGCAIEVKTTISKQHEKITITNEQQLDDTGLEKRKSVV